MNAKFSNLKRSTEGRLLIVDDEPFIRSMLIRAFSFLGYHAEEAVSGEEALILLKIRLYDVMILDLNLPDLNGVEVMQKACKIQPELLIIVLTGNASLDSAVAAIKSDAIDYLYKPSSIHEVVSAVTQALQKRAEYREKFEQLVSEALDEMHKSVVSSNPLPPDSDLPATRSIIIIPPLQLDRPNRLVTLTANPDHTINLTKGETAVLYCLMLYPGQPLSSQQLVRLSWGYNLVEEEAGSVIRPYISRLRSKFETALQNTNLIFTVRGQGYQFTSPK